MSPAAGDPSKDALDGHDPAERHATPTEEGPSDVPQETAVRGEGADAARDEAEPTDGVRDGTEPADPLRDETAPTSADQEGTGPIGDTTPTADPGASGASALEGTDLPTGAPGDGPAAGENGTAPEDRAPPPNIVERTPGWLVPAVLVGVPLLAILLGRVSDAFYANVIWKYYWGPIVADAAGRSMEYGGVVAHSGYNLVNTFSWAVLLGLAILGVAQLLHRFGTPMDKTLILGATAWVVSGSVWHVMQDADLLRPPFEYLFITPPIYLMFAAFGVLSFLIGHYLVWVQRGAGLDAALQKLWFIFAIGVLLWTGLWSMEWDMIVHYVNPIWVVLIAAVGFFVVRARAKRTGVLDPRELTLMMALPGFLLSLLYTWSFLNGGTPLEDAGAWARGGPDAWWRHTWLLAPLGSAAIVAVIYLLARGREGLAAQAFRQPINLLIIFAHALDGLGTAIGLDFIRTYSEKHVVSGKVIDGFAEAMGAIGWEFGAQHPTLLAFLPLKVALGILVVYLIDVYSREDLERYPTLIGLVKFAIIMVGIGPGIRNVVRMSLGT